MHSERTLRRRHSTELKTQVLAECDEAGASIASVAQSHGLNVNFVHKWRRCQRQAVGADTHMPAAHRAHLEWTPQRLIDWGQRIGVACGELVKRLLQTYKHPEYGYRSCLGLPSLSRRYGNARLEAACERALALAGHLPLPARARSAGQQPRSRCPGRRRRVEQPRARENVRGPGDYQDAALGVGHGPSAARAAPAMASTLESVNACFPQSSDALCLDSAALLASHNA
jgi:hypothetical protein